MLIRLAASWWWRPPRIPDFTREWWQHTARVAAVIPAYNESADSIITTIRSLHMSTRRPDTVFVVDDGSADRDGITDLLFRASRSNLDVRVLPMATNQGKRFAQAEAWQSTQPGDYDVWLIIDSDTTLAPRAVERMVDTFADIDVHAATSLILPRNRGLLARIQEIEYATSQLTTRMVWNWIGTVPVISGGFSAVRDHVIRRNLGDYLAGYWGVHIGDDRHMAIMANITGRVVVCPGARSYTEVPTRVPKLLKQRARWARSFYLGAFWSLRHASRHRIAWVTTWNLFTVLGSFALLGWVIWITSTTGSVWLVGYVAVFTWLRSYRYLREPHPDPAGQYIAWLLAPLSNAFGLFVLMPVQLWALVTCRRSAWGTRSHANERVSPVVRRWVVGWAAAFLAAMGAGVAVGRWIVSGVPA